MKRFYTGSSLVDPGIGEGLALKVAAGATTGALGAAIGNPVDLVRVKLQGESGRMANDGLYATGLRKGHAPSHANTLSAFLDIAQAEGVRGLWRGVSASVCRVALLSGGQLSTYDQAKQTALRSGLGGGAVVDGPVLHFCCSALSGVVAQVACMPADVVKTRVQARLHASHNSGPLQCFLAVLRHEGPAGLYRGFSAAAARQVPVMAIQMPIVEQFRKVIGLEYL